MSGDDYCCKCNTDLSGGRGLEFFGDVYCVKCYYAVTHNDPQEEGDFWEEMF